MGTRLTLREWLHAGGCAFVCPLTGEPLCESGEERELTVHNLQEYTHLVAQLWLADGVLAQARAFREGLEEVFPLDTLSLFSLSELQTVRPAGRHCHPRTPSTSRSPITAGWPARTVRAAAP